MEEPLAKRIKQKEEWTSSTCCEECEIECVTRHNLNVHLIREHKKTIDVLPDEMVEIILKFIRQPKGLVGISGTSKRYKNLVEEFFSRKFSSLGRVVIGINSQRQLGFRHDLMKKYENRFRALIINVKVNFCNRYAPIDVESTFRFIAANCSNDIRSFELYSRCKQPIYVFEEDFSIIKDKITNLERLALEFDIFLSIPIEKFTFSKLRVLYIGVSSYNNENESLLEFKFPKLQTLCVLGYPKHENIKLFLHQNEHLNTVACMKPDTFSKTLYDQLDKVIVPSKYSDESFLLNLIEKCPKRNFIDIFYFISQNTDIYDVKSPIFLDKGMSLHMFNEFFKNWCNLNIQKLCIYFDNILEFDLHQIIIQFPNLIELRLKVRNWSWEHEPHEILKNLIRGLPKLRHFYFHIYNLHAYTWNFHTVGLVLENSANVTVHLNKLDTSIYRESIEQTRNGICIKFEDDSPCPVSSIRTDSCLLTYLFSLKYRLTRPRIDYFFE